MTNRISHSGSNTPNPSQPTRRPSAPASPHSPAQPGTSSSVRSRSVQSLDDNPARHGSSPQSSRAVTGLQRQTASQVTSHRSDPNRKPYDPGADVKTLDKAMAGWGTDEDAIFNVLKGKTPEQRAAIKAAYKKRTGRTLESDLKSELSGSEMRKASALLTQGRQTEADRIRDAVEGMGTDENTVFRMLEGKTETEVKAIKADYKKKFGEDLGKRLESEMSGSDLSKARNLLKGEPEGDPSIKDPKAREADRVNRVGEKSAELLANAMDGMGTDENTVLDTLHGKSKEEREAIKAAYKKKTGRELTADLKDEMSGSDLKMANSYLENGRESAADKIHRAVDGMGTDEKLIVRTLEGMKPEERKQMLAEYEKKHGESLEARLKDELSGADKAEALALLKNGKLDSKAKIDVAMAGMGTDEDAIYAALSDASPEERKAMAGDKKFMARLDSELSGSEKEKALELLKNGKLDTRASLSLAMTGMGTDEDAIYDALKKASPEERQAIMKDPKMMERLKGELSGDEFAKAQELLKNGKLSTSTRLDEAMSGMGTDEKGVYSALEEASAEERKKLAADPGFRTRLRSELSGSELERAEKILENGPLSAKEKVNYASDGMGTDEDAIFDALRNASEEERKTLQKDPAFQEKLRSELSGSDLERAELLLAKGKTSNVEDLKLAMDGAGTDENAIFSVLGSLKTDEEREKLVQEYRDRHGRDLLSDLKSDLSSSEFRKAEAALRTRPKSVDEAMDRVYDDMARDRDGGGWTSASSGIMDTFSDRGRDLDDQFREMRLVERNARLNGTKDDPQTLEKINSMGDKFTVQQADYHEAKQKVAKTANLALSVVAVTALTVATAGSGAVLVPTLWAAGATGTSKVLLNKAILGSDYDAVGYDGATGFATGAAEMLATGGAISAGKVLYGGASLAKGSTVLKLAEKGAVSGGITGSSMGAFKTAISDGTWDRGFGEGLGSVLSSGFWGGLIGAGVGGAFDGAWAKTTGGLFSKTVNELETGVSMSGARRFGEAAAKQEGALRKFITGAPKNQVKGEISGALEDQ